jgi:hypothetical protein
MDVGRSHPFDTAQASQQSKRKLQQEQMRRELVIYTETREVIFRVVDVRSGQVDRQVPDQALLRLRAYNRTLARDSDYSSTKR